MRVIQLGAYPPPHGGVESNIVAIQEYLLSRHHWCRVINLTRNRRANTPRVAYPQSALDVLKLLREWDFDIAHLHVGGSISSRLVLLGLVLCLQPKSKAVLTLHSGGWPSSKRGEKSHRRSLMGFVFRRFDRIICVNPDILDFFRRMGVAESRLRVITPYAPRPMPAGDLHSAPDEMDVAGDLKRFFRDHHPILLTIGGLEPEYDLECQIEAMEGVIESHEDAGLVIIGAGNLEDELRRKIEGLPYGTSILLCGDVPHDWTLRAMAASNLFLRTTHYDGDAISVREALSAGTPVVATDNGMRPAGVDLVPVSDSKALEAAILSRLSSPGTPQRCGEEVADDGAALVSQEYIALISEQDGSPL